MSLPQLFLKAEVSRELPEFQYVVSLPEDWNLQTKELFIGPRGSNALSVRTTMRKDGNDVPVVVLVRPLDALIPNADDCVGARRNTWKDCLKLSEEKYRQELSDTEAVLITLRKESVTAQLYEADVLDGKTEGAPDARFAATRFGVEAWEAFSMSLAQYVEEFNIGKEQALDELVPMIMRLCAVLELQPHKLFHRDLHFGNVVVNLDATGKIVDMRLIDLSSVSEKQSHQCTVQSLMNDFFTLKFEIAERGRKGGVSVV